jgi:hypothetical protein
MFNLHVTLQEFLIPLDGRDIRLVKAVGVFSSHHGWPYLSVTYSILAFSFYGELG